MSYIDLNKVQYNWVKDILDRIEDVIKNSNYTDEEKLIAIQWLVKQASKVNTDE